VEDKTIILIINNLNVDSDLPLQDPMRLTCSSHFVSDQREVLSFFMESRKVASSTNLTESEVYF
jgi:hypothetical protein